MRKVGSIILAFIMLVNLTACGGKSAKSKDPNVGMWKAVSASMMDVTQDIKDVFEKGVSLELKSNGKFNMVLDGEKINGKWSYKHEELTLSQKAATFTGTIENGMLTLYDMLNIGLDLTFEKEEGYNGTSSLKAKGDAGYYVIEKAIENGETMTAEELEEMSMFAYVLLNEDGTFVCSFGEDDVDTGIWEKGVLNFQNAQGEIEESIDYKLKGNQMTIDWGGDFIVVYVRSKDAPPVESSGKAGKVKKLSELQEWWDGEWYGYWEAHSVTDDYMHHDDAWWDAYATIEMNSDDTGTIYLWQETDDLATVEVKVSKDGGSGEMGAAVSESGYYWNGDKIGHADWIIDPSLYGYEDYMVIDGRYEDENGEGFNYVAYLRPWGQLWDDIPDNEKPPGYGWYLENYTENSMLQAVGAHNGVVHSELAYTSSKPTSAQKPAPSASGEDAVGNVSGERIDTGIISALCPDGWKSYDVADYFSDDDDAIDPTRLEFHKGAQTPDDQFFKPGIDISYYDKNSYYTPPKPADYFVDSARDWGPVELSGRRWEGFVDLDRGDSYIWTKEGNYHLGVILWQEDGGEDVFLEDADVQAILSSIGVQ